MSPAPKAHSELQKFMIKSFKSFGKKAVSMNLVKIYKPSHAPKEMREGFMLASISKTKMDMKLPKGMNMGGFKLPNIETATKDQVVFLSEKPFSMNVFKVPKGYKKVKPPKIQRPPRL